MNPKMPDITKLQVAAVVGWIITQAVSYGWLDVRYEKMTLSISVTVVAAALAFAEAHIRGRRAIMHGMIRAAQLAPPPSSAPVTVVPVASLPVTPPPAPAPPPVRAATDPTVTAGVPA